MTRHIHSDNSAHTDALNVDTPEDITLFEEFNKVAGKAAPPSPLSGLGYWASVKLTKLLQSTGYNKRKLKALNGKSNVLNIGCGTSANSQLVNTDILPHIKLIPGLLLGRRTVDNDLFLDLPLYDRHLEESMIGIVLSHVLEHIAPVQAMPSLRNCFEYLKPGGVIRVSVPHLAAYDRETIPPDHDVTNRNLAKNCLVYAYGHRFMYDESLLMVLLRKAGFTQVETTSYGQGVLADTDSEHHKEESIYVTGIKPDNT